MKYIALGVGCLLMYAGIASKDITLCGFLTILGGTIVYLGANI